MPLTTQPFADNPELNRLRKQLAINVAEPERYGSVIGGTVLALYGVAHRGVSGALLALLGGILVHRGVTGHCNVYEQMGVDTAAADRERGVPGNKGTRVEKTVTIDRTPQELFRFWRNFTNLCQFMPHLESVRETGSRRSHWVAKGPAGMNVEWDAEIVSEQEGRMISWQSLPGSEVQNAGSVWFEPAANGTGTDVKVALQYHPPGGVVGAVVAKIFGEAPDQQLEQDLNRLKQLFNSGTVA
jgi:uncharacterized membrane protein